jgi:predicted transcriptional regulator
VSENIPTEVSQSTIEILENLLEQAKSGELVGLIYIGIKQGDRNRYGWAGEAGCDPLVALGALERLKIALLEDAKERGY